jgi:hypothetical protein
MSVLILRRAPHGLTHHGPSIILNSSHRFAENLHSKLWFPQQAGG